MPIREDSDPVSVQLDGLTHELDLRNEELRKLKKQVEEYGAEMARVRKTHVYEMTLLQKTVSNLRGKKKGQVSPGIELTERLTKIIKEREHQSARIQQVEQELQEAKEFNAVLLKRLEEKSRSPRAELKNNTYQVAEIISEL